MGPPVQSLEGFAFSSEACAPIRQMPDIRIDFVSWGSCDASDTYAQARVLARVGLAFICLRSLQFFLSFELRFKLHKLFHST